MGGPVSRHATRQQVLTEPRHRAHAPPSGHRHELRRLLVRHVVHDRSWPRARSVRSADGPGSGGPHVTQLSSARSSGLTMAREASRWRTGSATSTTSSSSGVRVKPLSSRGWTSASPARLLRRSRRAPATAQPGPRLFRGVTALAITPSAAPRERDSHGRWRTPRRRPPRRRPHAGHRYPLRAAIICRISRCRGPAASPRWETHAAPATFEQRMARIAF